MKIATLKLASCSGCHIALLDTHEKFLEIVDKIVFSPILLDTREIPDCDIVLVEGSVRTKEELNLLKNAREKSNTVVAFGSCAALGGITSLGNIFSGKQIIESVYSTELKNTPEFLNEALPIDEFVEVDYYLPGCPPPPNLIVEFLEALLKGEEPKKIEHPVCAECGRIVEHRKIDSIKRFGEAEKGVCLLSQGFLCLGSITRGGCNAACVKAGLPCIGCRGPTPKIMRSYCRDNLNEILERSKRIIKQEITVDDIAYFYTFVFGSDMKDKPISMIKDIMRGGRYGRSNYRRKQMR